MLFEIKLCPIVYSLTNNKQFTASVEVYFFHIAFSYLFP